MGQSVEGQRAIIVGVDLMKPSKTVEARAMLKIPSRETLLKTYDNLTFLSLQGRWDPESGYTISWHTNNTWEFNLEVEAYQENVPANINELRLLIIILEDGRVFKKSIPPSGWLPYDPDKFPVEKYEEEYLAPLKLFDFEAMWERVGGMNNPEFAS